MQLLVQQLSPESSDYGFGIVTLETASYVLQAYRPDTGVQFFVTADLRTEHLAQFLVWNPCFFTFLVYSPLYQKGQDLTVHQFLLPLSLNRSVMSTLSTQTTS